MMARTSVNEPRVHPQFWGTSTIFLYGLNSLSRHRELRHFPPGRNYETEARLIPATVARLSGWPRNGQETKHRPVLHPGL